jgi:RNA polymerase sigma factor (sigma-70 family)
VLDPTPPGGPRGGPAPPRLYRRHVDDVYRYAAALLRNPADAEDVVQTTFLNAFRAMEQGQRPRYPLSWLMAIAHNVCRQRYRQQSTRLQEVAFEDDLASAEDEEDGVSAEDIRRALSQLSFNQRAAIVMREMEGRSYAEIAERLEISHSAVETLIFRARRALREQLDGTMTCSEAGRAISRQLDGQLARKERSALRAHLRSCPDCRSLARRLRGQRASIKALAALPLPASLAGFSTTGGGIAAGVGVRALLLKLAGAAAVLAVAGGAGYEAVQSPALPAPAVRHAPVLVVPRPAQATPVATARTIRAAAATTTPSRPQTTSATTTESRSTVPPARTQAPAATPVVSAPPTRHGAAAAAAGGAHAQLKRHSVPKAATDGGYGRQSAPGQTRHPQPPASAAATTSPADGACKQPNVGTLAGTTSGAGDSSTCAGGATITVPSVPAVPRVPAPPLPALPK